jgi:hypothetical protein
VALAYLSLPLLIFFAGFIRPIVAGPAMASILGLLYRAHPRPPLRTGLGFRYLAVCAAIAAAYLWACGYAPPGGRSWDWIKHFAIFNELAQQPWPPVREDAQTFLRYCLGYYLLPGLLAKLFGGDFLEGFVFLQTWLGLTLVLTLLLQKIRPKRPAIFVLFFLLFSGLDLVGFALFKQPWSLLAHKEWWATQYAYEGHATLFLWVPQHALAGLLGVAVMLPQDDQGPCTQAFGLLAAAVLFWSPFAALGLLPFLLIGVARAGPAVLFDPGNILGSLMIAVPLLAYLLAGSGAIPHGFIRIDDWRSTASLATFLMLEVGLYLIALRLYGWHHLRYPGVIVSILLLLPLYRVGMYNDFTMRTCIPAIALVGIAASAAASDARDRACMPLMILMVVGTIGSVLEIIGRAQDGHVSVRDVSLRSGFLNDDPAFSFSTMRRSRSGCCAGEPQHPGPGSAGEPHDAGRFGAT